MLDTNRKYEYGKAPSHSSAEAAQTARALLEEVYDVPQVEENTTVYIVTLELPLKVIRDSETNEFIIKPSYLTLLSTLYKIRESYGNIRAKFVGWPGIHPETSAEADSIVQLLQDHDCIPVFAPDKQTFDNFLYFSHKILWPLFHNVAQLDSSLGVEYNSSSWISYQQMNKQYGLCLSTVVHESDSILLNDFSLLLVSQYLMKKMRLSNVGLFFHSSFPSYETFRQLPVREEILRGILSNDMVGFHFFDVARHFIVCVRKLLGLEYSIKLGGLICIDYNGRTIALKIAHVTLEPFLIEKDLMIMRKELQKQIYKIRQQYKDQYIYIAIDRCDRLSGLGNKLRAFRNALRAHPEIRGKICLIQHVIIPLVGWVSHEELKGGLEKIANDTNEEFSVSGKRHVDLRFGDLSVIEKWGLYLSSDGLIDCSIRDGFNLTPGEYILVRSLFAGMEGRDKRYGFYQQFESLVGSVKTQSGPQKLLRKDMKHKLDAVQEEDEHTPRHTSPASETAGLTPESCHLISGLDASNKFIDENSKVRLDEGREKRELRGQEKKEENYLASGDSLFPSTRNDYNRWRSKFEKAGMISQLDDRSNEKKNIFVNKQLALEESVKSADKQRDISKQELSFIHETTQDYNQIGEREKDNNQVTSLTNGDQQQEKGNGYNDIELPIDFPYGSVILSEFTGACKTLISVSLVNPLDEEEVGECIYHCSRRHWFVQKDLQDAYLSDTFYLIHSSTTNWMLSLLYDLRKVRKRKDMTFLTYGLGTELRIIGLESNFRWLDAEMLVSNFRISKRRLFLFDYEGTLTLPSIDNQFVGSREKSSFAGDGLVAKGCFPSENLLQLISRLSENENNIVCILSGRDKRLLSTWFAHIPNLILCAEHGNVILIPQLCAKWRRKRNHADDNWRRIAGELMLQYVKRTPGSFIENKGSALVFQYRASDEEFGRMQAKELHSNLTELLYDSAINIVSGKGYVEARLKDVNKGTTVEKLIRKAARIWYDRRVTKNGGLNAVKEESVGSAESRHDMRKGSPNQKDLSEGGDENHLNGEYRSRNEEASGLNKEEYGELSEEEITECFFPDFILCIGDDRSDEDMFKVVNQYIQEEPIDSVPKTHLRHSTLLSIPTHWDNRVDYRTKLPISASVANLLPKNTLLEEPTASTIPLLPLPSSSLSANAPIPPSSITYPQQSQIDSPLQKYAVTSHGPVPSLKKASPSITNMSPRASQHKTSPSISQLLPTVLSEGTLARTATSPAIQMNNTTTGVHSQFFTPLPSMDTVAGPPQKHILPESEGDSSPQLLSSHFEGDPSPHVLSAKSILEQSHTASNNLTSELLASEEEEIHFPEGKNAIAEKMKKIGADDHSLLSSLNSIAPALGPHNGAVNPLLNSTTVGPMVAPTNQVVGGALFSGSPGGNKVFYPSGSYLRSASSMTRLGSSHLRSFSHCVQPASWSSVGLGGFTQAEGTHTGRSGRGEEHQRFFTVTVGKKPSSAKWFLFDVEEVMELLNTLATCDSEQQKNERVQLHIDDTIFQPNVRMLKHIRGFSMNTNH